MRLEVRAYRETDDRDGFGRRLIENLLLRPVIWRFFLFFITINFIVCTITRGDPAVSAERFQRFSLFASYALFVAITIVVIATLYDEPREEKNKKKTADNHNTYLK